MKKKKLKKKYKKLLRKLDRELRIKNLKPFLTTVEQLDPREISPF